MFTTTYNPYKHDIRLKIGRFTKTIKDPNFPYLERAIQTILTLRRMSMKVPGADLRGEQNEVELNLNLIELQTLVELWGEKKRVSKVLFCKNGKSERGLVALGSLYTLCASPRPN